MRTTIRWTGVTALAAVVGLGAWLCLRAPDAQDASVVADAPSSGARSSEQERIKIDESATPAEIDGSPMRTPVAASTAEKTVAERSSNRAAAAGSVHLFGSVAGIPPNARFAVSRSIEDRARSSSEFASGDRDSRSDQPGRLPPGTIELRGWIQLADDEGHAESAVIDASGNYSVSGLHPGRWDISVDVEQCRPLRTSVELRADEAERRLDLRIEPKQHIDVHFITHAEPSPNATGIVKEGERRGQMVEITAAREPPGETIDRAMRGTTQTSPFLIWFSGADEGAGAAKTAASDQVRTLYLEDKLPLYLTLSTRGIELETKLADVGMDAVMFDIDLSKIESLVGSVRLRVVERDGGALAEDCTVELRTEPVRYGWHGSPEPRTAAPDSNGDVSFTKLTAGRMTLVIRSEDHEQLAQDVLVKPGEATDLGTFALDRWCSITGRTLDSEGRPVSVLLNVYPLDRFEDTRVELSRRFFKSNEEGELKIPSIGHGRYLVRVADDKWGAAPRMVDTTRGAMQGLEIRLQPKVDVTLRFQPSFSGGSLLRVTTGDGLPVFESDMNGTMVQLTSDMLVAPVRLRLVPGLYALHVTRGDGELLHSALFVDTKASEVMIPQGK
jgi:hypothetical protein